MTLVTTGVLTRILMPGDFGLVAVAAAVVTMFDLITRVGFGASVVRRTDLDDRTSSTLFWASLFVGLFAGALAWVFATPAARLAGSTDAADLVRLAALTLPIGLATTVPWGLLFRDLRFKASAMVEIVLAVVYGVVAIGLALAGWGAMAVAVGQVVRSVLGFLVLFVLTRFRPRFVFDRDIIRQDLAFSFGVLGGDVVAYANRNADYWFVGNRLGPGPLGIYYVAYVIPNLLRQRFNSIGHEVLYPVVSRFQDDLQRIRGAYLKVMQLVSFLVIPTMLGMFAVADLAIRLGFGPGWEDAVLPMRIVALGAAVTSLGVIARPIFLALGKPRITVITGVVALAVMAAGLGVVWSKVTIVAVAFAASAGAVAEVVLTQFFVVRILGVKLRWQTFAVAPFVLSSLLMLAVVLGMRLTPVEHLPVVVEAVVLVASGVVAYLGAGYLLFRQAFTEQIHAVIGFLGLRRAPNGAET